MVVEGPAVEPVTRAEVYAHLRLTPDSNDTHPDDALLDGQIAAARQAAEAFTRRAFVSQKLRMTIDRFPCFRVRFGGSGWDDDDFLTRSDGFVELRRPPVVSVDAVEYLDQAGAVQTVAPTTYFVTDDFVPRLQFTDAFQAPTVAARSDAIRITYRAGYPPDGSDLVKNVPAPIKQAILLGVQLLYDEIAADKRPQFERARDALLSPFRVHSL